MRCRDAERALALYLDERVAGPLPSALSDHLVDCPACRDEWAALRRVEALFARAPLADPSPDFAAAVLARIDAGVERVAAVPARRRWLRRGWLGAGLVAGSLLLVALLISLTIWGLIAYGLSTLVTGWLQDPQVVNTWQALLAQADFWVTTSFQTLLTVVEALLPWIAFGAVAFVFLSVLAYVLVLAWGWLIGRVWWSGPATAAVNGG